MLFLELIILHSAGDLEYNIQTNAFHITLYKVFWMRIEQNKKEKNVYEWDFEFQKD